MTPEQVRDFLRHNHHAVIATTRADGGVQLSPVAAGIDGDGTVIVSSTRGTAKVRNLRSRPRATLCILNDGFFGDWAYVEGPVVIEDLPDAMESLVRYYRIVAGEHPDWDEYRAAMEKEGRVLLRITIERAGPSA